MTPEQHIAHIREVKFGLKPDGRYEPNPLAGDLHDAILNLSQGLYSKDVHFVLELIQNAEDNHYAPNGKPTLSFHLLASDPTDTPGADGALLVVNNEVGFTETNIEALCGVGKTTKDKCQGYIGEKGIGFKSVFVVSGRPHIFSRGYQVRFQEEPDSQAPLGYIVPYWVPQVPQVVREHREETCIVLPLKPGKRVEVANQLATIAPETVLFLSKLEGLAIHIEGQPSIRVERHPTNHHCVRLVAGDRSAEFWVVHREVEVPDDLVEEKREGVRTRTVSVALPLSSQDNWPYRVFAFLPTEVNSGLPFFINADFILPASRETIQYDRPWNHWLRDCIAPLFADAFESLLRQPRLRYRAYSFIPLLTNIDLEFFRPIAESIHQMLSTRRVVWAVGASAPTVPPNARLASANFQGVISKAKGKPNQLRATPLVRPQIATYERQLKAIGTKDLTGNEIIACLNDEEWLNRQDVAWFVTLYRYLMGREAWATRDRLIYLKLLPVEGDRLASSAEQPVYFSPQPGFDIAHLHETVGPLINFAFLRPELHTALGDDRELKGWLRTTLGVRDLTVENVCLELAQTLHEHRSKVDKAVLIAGTRYIRDHSDGCDEQWWDWLWCTLPLLMDSGCVSAPCDLGGSPLVMPAALDPETGWSLVFDGYWDRTHMAVLSDAYLEGSTEDDLGSWRKFFQRLGATDAPFPKRLEVHWSSFDTPSDIPAKTRQYIISNREYSSRHGGYYLIDFQAPEWLHRLAQPESAEPISERQVKALLNWLKRRRSTLDQCGSAKYGWYYRGGQSKDFASDFAACLRTVPWLPTTQGLKCPSAAFLDRPEVREIFGDTLPYALEPIPDDLARWLGMHVSATRDEVMEYLKQSASRPASEANPATIQKIYKFLADRWDSNLRAQFESRRLILSRAPEPRWLTLKECIWPDLAGVFGSTYAYLEVEYPALKDFFVTNLGVDEHMDPQLYVRQWLHLSSKPHTTIEVETALRIILPELLSVLEDCRHRDWWKLFRSEARIWTHRHRFEPPDRVFLPDDAELKELFANQVGFAWIPPDSLVSDYRPLLNNLGVQSAASCARAVPQPTHVRRIDEDDLIRLTPSIKRAIALYLRNETRNLYQMLKEQGVIESLLTTRDAPAQGLTIVYELGGSEVFVPDGLAFWDRKGRALYWSVDHDQELVEVEIASTLARQLTAQRPHAELDDFIGRILGASDAKIEAIARKHNWSLPEEEEAWIRELLELEPTPAAREAAITDTELSHPKMVNPQAGHASGATDGTDDSVPRKQPPRHDAPGQGISDDVARSYEPIRSGSPPRPTDTSGYRGRLFSYIEPKDSFEQPGSESLEASAHRHRIDAAGLQTAQAYERSRNRHPEVLEPNHAGWDINSYEPDPTNPDGDPRKPNLLARRIEVKATEGSWDGWGVGLTTPQHEAAQKYGEDYYLYVVEHALDPGRRSLYVFKDPVSKITAYRLDDGWKRLADEQAQGI